MSWSGFVLSNLLRNKRRSFLTLVSLAASVFLVTTLEGLLRFMNDAPRTQGSERRLIVRRSTSLQDRLPESYVGKVRALPGVETASPMLWFGGIYRDSKPENFFGQLSCDPEEFHRLVPEAVPVDPKTGAPRPELYEEFRRDRTAAIAARELFLKYGWELGDRITIIGTIYPVNLELTLRAAYHAESGTDNQTLYYHHRYVDELLGRPGLIGVVSVRAESVDLVSPLIDRIDAQFANSEFETLTETERSFQLGFVQMLGNISLFVRAIATAIAFAMLMVAANTTAMAARERTHEIAVLKSIGFTPARVLTLLLGEAVLLGILGAGAGAGAAAALGPFIESVFAKSTISFFLSGYRLAAWIPLSATAVGALIGLAAALGPCTRVAFLPIATTLRRTA